jgi:hypothetical protein
MPGLGHLLLEQLLNPIVLLALLGLGLPAVLFHAQTVMRELMLLLLDPLPNPHVFHVGRLHFPYLVLLPA